MRKLYFLVPGTSGQFGGGGLWAELNTCGLAEQICSTEIVTYRQQEPDTTFLSELLPKVESESAIFVIGWGFDIPKLLHQLKGQNVIYHAHSSNYGFSVPANVPIIAVSRNTMGYWGAKAVNNLIYYLPNRISDEFYNYNWQRDIDILVQTRKSSEYLLQHLVPALQSLYRVEIVDRYVEDLASLFNRSKIYLYDSAEYWSTNNVTEGFGLPPLEAIACGCHLFSSLNHGLADYLDPGFNCHKIAGYALEYDLLRIKQVLQQPNLEQTPAWLSEYRGERLTRRLTVILSEINRFFDHQPVLKANIKSLTIPYLWQLQLKQFGRKFQRRINRK